MIFGVQKEAGHRLCVSEIFEYRPRIFTDHRDCSQQVLFASDLPFLLATVAATDEKASFKPVKIRTLPASASSSVLAPNISSDLIGAISSSIKSESGPLAMPDHLLGSPPPLGDDVAVKEEEEVEAVSIQTTEAGLVSRRTAKKKETKTRVEGQRRSKRTSAAASDIKEEDLEPEGSTSLGSQTKRRKSGGI